jgi:hypothetical protein
LVNRPGGSSAYTGGVRQTSTALSLRSVFGQLTHVYFRTINETKRGVSSESEWEKCCLRGDLNQHRTDGDSQQRAPKVTHGMCSVDMAYISETVTHSRNGDSDGEKYCRDGPAETLGPIKELLSWSDVPTCTQVNFNLAAQQDSTYRSASASTML